jgi:hypothetical protein
MARTSFFMTAIVVATLATFSMPAVEAGWACVCNLDNNRISSHCGTCYNYERDLDCSYKQDDACLWEMASR